MVRLHKRHAPPTYEAMLYGWWTIALVMWTVCIPAVSVALDLHTLVDRIQENYDRMHALSADFLQVATLTSLGRQQTSAGRVYIEKPHYIRWEYTQPASQTILYDGSTLRIYTPERHQVLQSVIDTAHRRQVAWLFLAGVGKLQEAFTITLLSPSKGRLQYLRLLPRSRQASFTELHIAVNTQNYFIEELSIHDTIGNITTIRLSSLQVHQALPPQTFQLVLPPRTEILTPADFGGSR